MREDTHVRFERREVRGHPGPDHAAHASSAGRRAARAAGLGGTGMNDRGESRHGKTVWGPIGFGAMKLKLQRRCIAALFERNDRVLDVEEIFNLAREMI